MPLEPDRTDRSPFIWPATLRRFGPRGAILLGVVCILAGVLGFVMASR